MRAHSGCTVDYDGKEKTVTIKVHLGRPLPSGTDKMNNEYTSGGFQTITEDGLRMNLTIGRKAHA